MMLYSKFLYFSKNFLLAEDLFGRNPTNRKPLVGMPDADSAVITAHGPGKTSIGILFFLHALTILYPGSLTHGVPASVVRQTELPSLISDNISDVCFCSLSSRYVISFFVIPTNFSSFEQTRVSSHKITSQDFNASTAR